MLGRREMIAVKYFDLIPRYPPRVTGFQCLDHRLGKVCGISHEGGRHAGFDAIELVIEPMVLVSYILIDKYRTIQTT